MVFKKDRRSALSNCIDSTPARNPVSSLSVVHCTKSTSPTHSRCHCSRRGCGLPINYVVDRLIGANISQPMQVIRCKENHGSRAYAFPVAIDQHLDSSLPKDDHFFIWMTVRCVGRFAWVKRRYMDFEFFNGRGARLKELPYRAHVC